MPKNPSQDFSSQFKSTFRVNKEFCTFSDKRGLIKITPINALKNCYLLGSIFSNRLFLFIKIKNQLILFQLFKFKNEIISDLCISEKSINLIYFTEKNNVFLYSNKKANKIKKLNRFKKILYMKNYNRIFGKIVTIKFDKNEKYLVFIFANGNIVIMNFLGKLKKTIKYNYPYYPLYIIFENKSRWKIYGKKEKNEAICDLNSSKKNIPDVDKNINLIYLENFLIFQSNKILEIKCICHKKKLKNLGENLPTKKIIFLNDNTFLDYNKNRISVHEMGIKADRLCEFYLSLHDIFSRSCDFYLESPRNFISTCIFSFILFIEKDNLNFIKPLNEKYSRLIEIDSFNSRFDGILEIKFFGRENFFILSSKNKSIQILAKKDFKIKRRLFKNSSFLNFKILGIILISLDQNGYIHFLNLNTNLLISSFPITKDTECVFTFLKLNNLKGRLFGGNKFGIIRAWNIFLDKKSIYKPFSFFPQNKNNSKINCISISKNNKILGISCGNKKVLLWKNNEDKYFMSLNNLKSLTWSIDFSPVDKSMVCGMGNGYILKFSIDSGNVLTHFQSHGFPVICCKFTLDGLLLIGSFTDGKIKIWKVENGACINTISNHNNSVWSFDFTPKYKTIITSCAEGKIILLKDFGFLFSKQKKIQLKDFIKIQKYCDDVSSKKMFGHLFLKILNLNDPTLLFDFIKFIFKNHNNASKNFISNLVDGFKSSHYFFLTRCLVLWSSKIDNFFVAQILLNLSLKSQNFSNFLKNHPKLFLCLINLSQKYSLQIKKTKKILDDY
jgi:WD40 repeat protein